MVPYVVCAVVPVTVTHVLLFVLHVLRECEGDGNAGGTCGFGECVYGWYTWLRCFVLCSLWSYL